MSNPTPNKAEPCECGHEWDEHVFGDTCPCLQGDCADYTPVVTPPADTPAGKPGPVTNLPEVAEKPGLNATDKPQAPKLIPFDQELKKAVANQSPTEPPTSPAAERKHPYMHGQDWKLGGPPNSQPEPTAESAELEREITSLLIKHHLTPLQAMRVAQALMAFVAKSQEAKS